MGINIMAKTDYSMLFSGLSGSPAGGNSILGGSFSLVDYATIKNGSYSKLMKAYYGQNSSAVSSGVNKLVSGSNIDDSKSITALKSASDSLTKAVEALLDNGKDSVFKQKDIMLKDENGVETSEKGYDTDAIYKKVSAFVDAYNKVLSAAGDSNNTKVLSTAANMTTQTVAHEDMLGRIGITIGENNKLSIDEKVFKEADMTSVKSMMNGVGSYAYGIQTKASFINMYAKQDAAKAGGLYSQNALYNSTYLSSGKLYSSWF